MLTELISLSFEKIMQTRSYTMVVLVGENKHFAIYADASVGKTLQIYLANTEKPRPLTHDLLGEIFKAMDVRVKKVVINDLQDTVYFARLFLEQDINDLLHIIEVDARPSDCITLALMHGAPLFCTREVLDKTVPLESEE